MVRDIPPPVLNIALDWYRARGFDPGSEHYGKLMRPGDDWYSDPDERNRSLWYIYFHPPAYRNYLRPYTEVIIDAETLEVVKPRDA